MRRTSRRVGVLSALAAVAIVAVGAFPAGAQDAGVVVFRGVANAPGLCAPGIATLHDLGAPVASDCGPTGILNEDTTGWSIVSPRPDTPDVDADFCIGAAAAAGVGISTTDAGDIHGSCSVSGSGSVDAALGLLGAWCGMSHGAGGGNVTITGDLGTSSTSAAVEWIVSAGTVLPITDGDLNDGVVIAGVVDAVGAIGGGNCATTASVGFNVVGVLAAVAP